MKKYLLLLLPVVALLASGCPIGLDQPLGKIGTEKIDKQLLGKWHSTSAETEVQRVSISKRDDHSYKAKVLERGEMYSLETDELTGWVTTVNEKNFVFFKPDGEEKYYHYCYWWDGGSTLISCDLALLDGGVDAVTSTESLRDQVARSMTMEEWGKETTEWNKE
jgi:hypothetical protein